MRKALVVILAIGCGGHSDGLSLADYPQAVLEAVCQHEANCGEFPDVDTCLRATKFLSTAVSANGEAAISAGKVIYHSGKARECVDALANATCDTTDADVRNSVAAPCFETTTGALHAGDTCAMNIECISESCSAPSCPNACCMGTCIGESPPASNLPTGAMCSQQVIGNECTASAFCDSTTHLCTPLKSEGSTCNSGDECASGLGCAGSPAICKALPALGEACPDARCRDEGQICLVTCVKVGLAGNPCSSNLQCSSAYKCDTGMGKCVEGSGEGGLCVADDDCWGPNFCNVPANTTTGTCTALKLDGQLCGGNNQCANRHCNDVGMCETPAACI